MHYQIEKENRKQMKVLHLVASMNSKSGGLAQAVSTTVAALRLNHIESEVICIDDPNSDHDRLDELTIHRLGPRITSWSYSPKLKKWLQENLDRFEQVIVHGLWQHYGWALAEHVARTKHSKPAYFVMPHGMLDPYFQNAPERKLKALRNELFYKLFESKIINKANGMLFTCSVEKELAAEPFSPYSPISSHVVGLAVDAPPPYDEQMRKRFIEICPEAEKRGYLLYLGRIHEKKGVDNLIKAYTKLLKKDASLPMLVIAGPGLDTKYGGYVKSLASGQKEIHFTGMLTGLAKWGAYYGCEAFILPSHQENFGIAIVEAMACKKTVLISNKINIWREIKEGNAGLIMDDNADDTYRVISKWLEMTKSEKLEMCANAYFTYNRAYTLKAFAEAMEAVFKNKPINQLI